MDSNKIDSQAGRYAVQLHTKRGTPLAPIHTDNEQLAIYNAEQLGGKVVDTLTGWVWSHQTQTWLRPDTQAVIDAQFSKSQQDIDWSKVAFAIARDLEMVGGIAS